MTTNPPGNGDSLSRQLVEAISEVTLELDRTVSALRIAEQKSADAHLFTKNALERAEQQLMDASALLKTFKGDR